MSWIPSVNVRLNNLIFQVCVLQFLFLFLIFIDLDLQLLYTVLVFVDHADLDLVIHVHHKTIFRFFSILAVTNFYAP